MEQAYKNQVVVITGGGSGLGLAIAETFAKAGAKVCIVGRDIKKLETAQKQIGKCGIYSADVSNVLSVQKAINSIYKNNRRIDIVVNCAGLYGPIGKFGDNNLKDWKQAFSINFFGTAFVCHAVLPFMLKRKKGKIINLSGGGAVQPFPNFSAYASSKAAVVRFSENLAREYEKYNIQVNTIAPGALNTSVLDQVLKTGGKKVGEDFYKKSVEQKKSGGDSPYAAAELVLFLCLESNKLSGKLISAKWDAWKTFNAKEIAALNKTSEYTIRRIDNKYFKEI